MVVDASLIRRVAAEGVGTALLVAAVVALILTFGPVSGAHFNPAVSLADALQGGLRWMEAAAYSIAQVIGAFAGVAVADAMFDVPLYAWSHHVRAGGSQILSEGVATSTLLFRWLVPALPAVADRVIVAREDSRV